MVGGTSDADLSSSRVQNAIRFVINELTETNNEISSDEIEVVNVTQQVVAGVKYVFTLKFRNCGNSAKLCRVEVLQQLWHDPPHSILSSNCNCGERRLKKRSLVRLGGVHSQAVDMSDMQVNDAVNFAVNHLSTQSNGMYDVDFHRLVSGTKQVVAGVYFRLKIEMMLSSCEKSDRNTLPMLSECVDSPLRNVIECDVEVIDQAWNVPRHTLKQHHCRPASQRDNTLYFSAHPKLIGGMHDIGGKNAFETFKEKHGKQYGSVEEEAKRYGIFQSNMKIAKKIQEFDQGTATYGASQFADMTPEEFQKVYLPRRWNTAYDDRLKPAEIPRDAPATEFDWRQHGAVTEVKNQGSCGSCWAFSVTGNIEGQWAVNKKQLVSLSEQELVDCDKIDEGCNGGLPTNAYQEIQRLGGLETEGDYPYKGDDEKCVFEKQEARVYINGSLNISKDEEEMKAWIYKNGPTSIGINAFAMQFYLGGVSHPWKIFCSPNDLDHGVLIVGYGVKKGMFKDTPYWIVKNSWGQHWGEKGYYLVYRGAGVCGLNQMVTSAVIN